MCHDPLSYVSGRAYTDSSWLVCQVGVEIKEEEKQTSGSPALLDFGAWNVRTVLNVGALKSLITQLLNCKFSRHTGDWIDRCRLNMGH